MPKESLLSENAGRDWLENNGHIDSERQVVPSVDDVPVVGGDPETIDNVRGEDAMIEELDRKKIIEKLEKRFSPAQMDFLCDVTVSPENFNFDDLHESDKLRYIDIVKRLKFLLKNNSFREDYFQKKSVSAVVPEKPKSKFSDETIETTFSKKDLDVLADLLLS